MTTLGAQFGHCWAVHRYGEPVHIMVRTRGSGDQLPASVATSNALMVCSRFSA